VGMYVYYGVKYDTGNHNLGRSAAESWGKFHRILQCLLYITLDKGAQRIAWLVLGG